MHLPLESLADNSCFHCTKILFHAMENKVSYQGTRLFHLSLDKGT